MPISNNRHYTVIDKLIEQFDQSLRTLASAGLTTTRPNPADALAEKLLTRQEQQHSAGLLRVDHAGEICAQALYQGQALTAHSNHVREKMQQAALEENDHLVWCKQRLQELNSRTSYLNPVWYIGSLLLGTLAGALGDKWNLGFVAETEHQVVKHLDEHLHHLPLADEKSHVILKQMRSDELQHATTAIASGGAELPLPVKKIMRVMAKIMTTSAYHL